MDARLARHDLLHGVAHLVVQRDERPRWPCRARRRRTRRASAREELERLADTCAFMSSIVALSAAGQVAVEILRLQNDLCHGATLHRACRGWSIEAAAVYVPGGGQKALRLPRHRPGRRVPARGLPAGRLPRASAGSCRTGARRWSRRCRAKRPPSRRFAALLPPRLPPAARVDAWQTSTRIEPRAGERRVSDRGKRGGRLRLSAHPAGPSPVRGLRARAPRSRATAATSTPSSPARSAGRATPSWSARRSTGRTPRCGRSRSARPARASTRTPRTGGSIPRPTPARRAGRGLSCVDASGQPRWPAIPSPRRSRRWWRARIVAVAGHRRLSPRRGPAQRRRHGEAAAREGAGEKALRAHGPRHRGGPRAVPSLADGGAIALPPPKRRS